MAVSGEQLKTHPGRNPTYDAGMYARLSAQVYNRGLPSPAMKVAVPKQPNKYVPHYGAKEAAKYAGRVAL